MPGIRSLGDRDFLRAFQAMDRVIQNRQPLFLLVWLGSPVALLTSATLAFSHLESANCAWLIAAAVHLLGVQPPTVVIKVPLNNQLQRRDVAAMTASELRIPLSALEYNPHDLRDPHHHTSARRHRPGVSVG